MCMNEAGGHCHTTVKREGNGDEEKVWKTQSLSVVHFETPYAVKNVLLLFGVLHVEMRKRSAEKSMMIWKRDKRKRKLQSFL